MMTLTKVIARCGSLSAGSHYCHCLPVYRVIGLWHPAVMYVCGDPCNRLQAWKALVINYDLEGFCLFHI